MSVGYVNPNLLLTRIEHLRSHLEKRKEEIMQACDRMYKHSKNLLDLNKRFRSSKNKEKIDYRENTMQELLDLVSFYRIHISSFLSVIAKTSNLLDGLSIEEASQIVFDMISSVYTQLWIIYQHAFGNLHTVHRHFLTGQKLRALSPDYRSTSTPDIVLNLGAILRGGIVFDVDRSPVYLRLMSNLNEFSDFLKEKVLKDEKLDIKIEEIFDSLICLVGWRNQIVHPGKEFRKRLGTEPYISTSQLYVCLGLEIPRLLTSMSLFIKFLFKEMEDVAIQETLLST